MYISVKVRERERERTRERDKIIIFFILLKLRNQLQQFIENNDKRERESEKEIGKKQRNYKHSYIIQITYFIVICISIK